MSKKLLIACYYYPPYPGIGGRRTAKFAMELAKQGHRIYVVGAKNPFSKESIWTEEARHPNISYHPVETRYPKVLLAPDDRDLRDDSVVNKLAFRLNVLYYKNSQKLRYYDPTFKMEEPYRAMLRELISKEEIDNVLVSVTPHYYTWFTAKFKEEECPELNFIIDFRDPWLSMTNYGIPAMSPSQRQAEQEIIKYTIGQTDAIIAPSEFVLDEFRDYLPSQSKAVEVLHPYDPVQIAEVQQVVSYQRTEKIRFVYGGTLYPDLAPALELLRDALDVLKKRNLNIYQKLDFAIYAHEREFVPLFEEHREIVSFFEPIGKAIMEEVFKADYVMMLYTEYSKNFRSTKFYAYLPSGRPYFYLGPKGDNYRFIKEEGVGVAFAQEGELQELLGFFEGVE
ncbi:MAG: hypothetical protein MRZ79_19315, partial [Bacteroidia bacterium]|nr:hypothetical protein [Bacteroidia bacterium]